MGAVPRVARSTGHRCGFSQRIASGEHGFGNFCQDKSHPRQRRGSLGLALLELSPSLLAHLALKRAEHRSHAWPKRRPCLSAASLGAVPRVARSTGHRCGFIAPDRVGRARFW
ncbi:hypothetical protein XcmpCFBP7700_06905 [Xanthomonas campestris]|nr:hypothetical protein XcmpCFBP7700_06905 [Xanthomonas campestris]